jgi:hypothetical protein
MLASPSPSSRFTVRRLVPREPELVPLEPRVDAAQPWYLSTTEVDATEECLTHDEVVLGLRSRRLKPMDLVFSEGAWRSLVDALPFAEVAEPLARRDERARQLRALLSGGLSLALVVGWLALASAFPDRSHGYCAHACVDWGAALEALLRLLGR